MSPTKRPHDTVKNKLKTKIRNDDNHNPDHNLGIGYATASVLSPTSQRNHVIMAGRSNAKLEAAVQKLFGTNSAISLSSIILDANDP